MPHPSHAYTRYAPVLCLLGVVLLAAAWPVSLAYYKTPSGSNTDIRGMLAMACALVMFPALIYASDSRFTPAQRGRNWLVAALFVTSLYSSTADANLYHVAHAIGITGLALLGVGLWHWPAALGALTRMSYAASCLCRRPGVFAFGMGLAMLAASLALGWACFRFLPAVVDSTAQYVHAKYMARGMLYGPGHPLHMSFPLWMVVNDTKFFAQYQPAYIALLGLGHALHAPWLVNPVCAAVTLWATYALARRIFDTPTALWAAFFMLCSQFLLFLASEYMNHTACLCFLTLFMLGFIRTNDAVGQGQKLKACLLGAATGACLGIAMLIRPLSAMGLSLPFIAYALYLLCHDRKSYLDPFVSGAAPMAASLAFQAWYNLQLTGNMLLFPSMAYHNNQLGSALGFGYGGPPSLMGVLEKRQVEWSMLNTCLFDWPIPCFILILAYVLRPARNLYASLLLASVASIALTGLANQFVSYIFGPRYLCDVMTALVILSAAGFMRLPALLSSLPSAPPAPQLRAACSAICLLCFAIALTTRLPLSTRYYANRYLDNDPALYQSLLAQSEPPALILMGHTQQESPSYYMLTLQYRRVSFTYPPSPSDDRIFAMALTPTDNQKLIAMYPGRHIYREQDGLLTLVKP